jgi:hypothetical protein
MLLGVTYSICAQNEKPSAAMQRRCVALLQRLNGHTGHEAALHASFPWDFHMCELGHSLHGCTYP